MTKETMVNIRSNYSEIPKSSSRAITFTPAVPVQGEQPLRPHTGRSIPVEIDVFKEPHAFHYVQDNIYFPFSSCSEIPNNCRLKGASLPFKGRVGVGMGGLSTPLKGEGRSRKSFVLLGRLRSVPSPEGGGLGRGKSTFPNANNHHSRQTRVLFAAEKLSAPVFNSIEFNGIRNELGYNYMPETCNPDFKPLEYKRFNNGTDRNNFGPSPQRKIEVTQAIGIRYGGHCAAAPMLSLPGAIGKKGEA